MTGTKCIIGEVQGVIRKIRSLSRIGQLPDRGYTERLTLKIVSPSFSVKRRKVDS
jgi:hypothetical protein